MKLSLLILSFSSFLAYGVINGQQDKQSRYSEVVQLSADDGSICTGTLISKKTILTAAHCLISITDSGKSYEFRSKITAKVITSGEEIKLDLEKPSLSNISQRYIKKFQVDGVDHYTLLEDADIAFLQTKEDVDFSEVIFPKINIQEDSIKEKNNYGENIFVGFGLTDHVRKLCTGSEEKDCFWRNKQGHQASQERYFGRVLLDYDDSYDKNLFLSIQPGTMIANLWNYKVLRPALSAPGDSGGPLYNKDKEIIGITIQGKFKPYNYYFVRLVKAKKSKFLPLSSWHAESLIQRAQMNDPEIELLR